MEQLHSDKLYGLSQQLLAYETGEGQSRAELVSAVERICLKFSLRLSVLVGGFATHLLFIHALRLSERVFPFLRGTEVLPDGHLKGLYERVEGIGVSDVRLGLTTLVANLIWQLAAFIGEGMVLHVIASIWTEITPGHTGIGSEEANR